MNPRLSKTTDLYACLCDSNRFSVTLMKNHYTFMHIRHHKCPIHLLANHYLFLLAMPVPGLVSNYKRYISHIQSSMVTCREKEGAQRQICEGTAGSEIDRKREGGRWRGSVWMLPTFHQRPYWSCLVGVYVSLPDDNVAWHFWNESRVAMAKGREGQSL